MTIYLFAGPNGSGKSTVIANYISFYGLEDLEYICPGIYAYELFAETDDIYERYKKAMDFAKYKRERLLKEGKSMENISLLAECSDELYIYDNSGDHPVLGLSMIDEDVFISSEAAQWVKDIIKK